MKLHIIFSQRILHSVPRVTRKKKMSKPDSGRELLKGKLITDEELLGQKRSEVISKVNRNRDSVIPFAKDMVENVVTGALSVLDVSRKEGKHWKEILAAKKISSETLSSQDPLSAVGSSAMSFSQTAETPSVSSVDGQRPVVQVMHLRVRENEFCDAGVHADQVAKIVKGLQDIQIGDSTYVLPADGSNIEQQVKRAVQNINSLEFGDMETARLIICDGQGDVDAKILEGEIGPPSNSKPQNDPSKISTCLLHKMIEEMEDDDGTKGASPDHGNKESIASWEESEEQFIRIIEGASGEERSRPVTSDNQELCPDDEIKNSLSQSQRVFVNEEVITPEEGGSHSRDLLDNSTDEEPYWCTAGLIKAVVTSPQHCEELRVSTLERRLQPKKSRTSFHEALSIVECDVNQREGEEKRSMGKGKEKVKEKKKESLGKKLRKFFSRFTRAKDS